MSYDLESFPLLEHFQQDPETTLSKVIILEEKKKENINQNQPMKLYCDTKLLMNQTIY